MSNDPVVAVEMGSNRGTHFSVTFAARAVLSPPPQERSPTTGPTRNTRTQHRPLPPMEPTVYTLPARTTVGYHLCREGWMSAVSDGIAGRFEQLQALPWQPTVQRLNYYGNFYNLVVAYFMLVRGGVEAARPLDDDTDRARTRVRGRLAQLGHYLLAPLLRTHVESYPDAFQAYLDPFRAGRRQMLQLENVCGVLADYWPTDASPQPFGASSICERLTVLWPSVLAQHPALIHFAIGLFRNLLCTHISLKNVKAGLALADDLGVDEPFIPYGVDVVRDRLQKVLPNYSAYGALLFEELMPQNGAGEPCSYLFQLYDAVAQLWPSLIENRLRSWQPPPCSKVPPTRPYGIGMFMRNLAAGQTGPSLLVNARCP